jgi:hypothetical protein
MQYTHEELVSLVCAMVARMAQTPETEPGAKSLLDGLFDQDPDAHEELLRIVRFASPELSEADVKAVGADIAQRLGFSESVRHDLDEL